MKKLVKFHRFNTSFWEVMLATNTILPLLLGMFAPIFKVNPYIMIAYSLFSLVFYGMMHWRSYRHQDIAESIYYKEGDLQ
jgi:hypothetical protein